MSAPEFIEAGGVLIGTHELRQVRQEGRHVMFDLSEGKIVRVAYASEVAAELGYESYKAALEVTGTYIMQPMYGEADAPAADPPITTMPAFYRGRANNTLWMWDTAELKWFPVVSNQ